jgi:hypothetical protein
MSSEKSQFPHGKRGAVTRVKTADGSEFEVDHVEDTFVPSEDMTEGPLASVGISATVGESTEYAREKFEISAWCTLPAYANEEAIVETYEVAYEFVASELERRKEDIKRRFFPHMIN